MPTLTERLYSATAQIEADIGSFRSGISTASGVSGFLSAALTQSGISLMARDTGISGALTTRVADTGSAAVAYAASLFSTASTNLTNSGVTLFSRDSAISGAIDTRLTQSGISLIARDTGISGALSSQIATTGQAAVAYASGISGALQTTLDLKAPLTSPALTGTPTAPTATIGTNTTQLATTEFVQGVVNLVKPGAETRGGIVSAGTSAVGSCGVLNLGTGDGTLGMWVKPPKGVPLSDYYFGGNYSSGFGVAFRLRASTGKLGMSIGDNVSSFITFESTVSANLQDEVWAFVQFKWDRDGNLVFKVNGEQVGNPVPISAHAAKSLSSQVQFTWMALGTSYSAGTLGECWIVAGLTSDARDTAIYRAGSIAPFCVMTPNTTTGQNTATIDGLSFFQWLEMERADPTNNPIIPDRSGNGQVAALGASGLFPAVRRNWANRALGASLVCDGSANSRIISTLNSQAPTTGELVLSWSGLWSRSEPDVNTRVVAALSGNSTAALATYSLALRYTPPASFIDLIFYGATTSDYRVLTSTTLAAHLVNLSANGIQCRFDVVRTAAGAIRIMLGIGGDASRYYDVTKLFVETTAGTPPAWSDAISSTYLIGAFRNTTYSATIQTASLAVANVAMTEAQLRAEYERGEPGPEWNRASNTPVYTSNFSAGTDGWTGYTGNTVAGNVDGVNGQDDWFSIQRTVGQGTGRIHMTKNLISVLGTQVNAGEVYVYTARIFNGSATPRYFNAGIAGAANGADKVLVAAGAQVDATFRYTVTSGIVGAYQQDHRIFVCEANGIIPDSTIPEGDVFYVKNITVKKCGWTTRLRTDMAAGGTAINDAKSATNDASDFLYTPTSVKAQPQNFRQRIRASTSTNGNQQLFGAACIDTTKKWRIRSWTIYCASGTPTTSLGDVSGGAQYVSSYVLAAGLNDVTPIITRLPATANLWCASDSTAQLDHVVILDLVE
jgi:hypothetical protein